MNYDQDFPKSAHEPKEKTLSSCNSARLSYQIVFKILLLTFKAIHKLAPTYISELVSLEDTGGSYYLRSNNEKLLNIPPCKSLSTLGDRYFYMAAPKLWNDPPLFIRNISSVNAFKKALKTHLFQMAFPSLFIMKDLYIILN